jgi:cytochrome oxidase Cu insertion factor (SCO1/SenC/PrrC family)
MKHPIGLLLALALTPAAGYAQQTGSPANPRPPAQPAQTQPAQPAQTPAAAAAVPQTHLKVGDPAPDFTLRNTDGKEVKLSDFRDKKTVVLAFYVLAFTGG